MDTENIVYEYDPNISVIHGSSKSTTTAITAEIDLLVGGSSGSTGVDMGDGSEGIWIWEGMDQELKKFFCNQFNFCMHKLNKNYSFIIS
jgi:hypothetical protein